MKVGMMVGIKKAWREWQVGASPRGDEAFPEPKGISAGARVRLGLREAPGALSLRTSDIHRGRLVLVNRNYPVRQRRMSGELADVAEAGLLGPPAGGVALEAECLLQLERLIAAANGKDEIAAVSGYRSRQEQKALYRQSLKDNGAAYTASYVALPGCSEHETGLAVDVCRHTASPHPIAPDFPDDGVCLAFKRLAARYGFIQRYREGKEGLTGIACEPWHYRYVGVPHAEWMDELDLCLEEYVEFVRSFSYESKRLVRMEGGARSEIYYVAADNGARSDIPLPDCDRWTCSGNNADGFVVTAFWGADDDGFGDK